MSVTLFEVFLQLRKLHAYKQEAESIITFIKKVNEIRNSTIVTAVVDVCASVLKSQAVVEKKKETIDLSNYGRRSSPPEKEVSTPTYSDKDAHHDNEFVITHGF